MKFGKSIESQQECNGKLQYVNYKTLKKRIKDVVEKIAMNELAEALDANALMEEELAKEIVKVNACFARRQNELLRQTGALAKKGWKTMDCLADMEPETDSMAAIRDQASSSGEGYVCQPDAFRALVGILADVDQLRKYAVWNAVAVVKILKKRRKLTSYGLKDAAAERAGWLSRQSFFSDSKFAELHAAVESAGEHVISRLASVEGRTQELKGHGVQECQQCPICLDTISDMIELSCGHRFCWKCFVLGPIACQPGEYRITRCPLCRTETCPLTTPGTTELDLQKGFSVPNSKGVLTRFLHTYFSPPGDLPLGDCVVPGGGTVQQARREGEESEREMRDVVGELVRALLADPSLHAPAVVYEASPQHCYSQCYAPGGSGHGHGCSDFFQTLPPKAPAFSAGAAHKLQWLQVASSGDPLSLACDSYCSLCSEPLLMDAVLTTPCKHQFHRVCVGRLDEPKCPLCREPLPFSWFLPAEHPCCDQGFQVVPARTYQPDFAGGPSKGTHGYPLHRPPPVSLHGPRGLVMKSYLHRLAPPQRPDDGDVTPRARCVSGSSSAVHSPDTRAPVSPERPSCPSAPLSSPDTRWGAESSDDDDDVASVASGLKGKAYAFAYSSLGRVSLLQQQPSQRQ